MKIKKERPLLILFLTFLKLGLFSIGGGPTMISLLHDELILKKHWLNDDELSEMIGISESTPGPIAINLATYLGFKRAGVLGSIVSTIGVILPPFVIMLIISLFFNQLMQYEVVQYAFMGIKCGIIFLLISVSIKLIKGLEKSVFNIILFLIVSILLITFTILSISFSSIYFILIGAFLGLIYYGIVKIKLINKRKKDL